MSMLSIQVVMPEMGDTLVDAIPESEENPNQEILDISNCTNLIFHSTISGAEHREMGRKAMMAVKYEV